MRTGIKVDVSGTDRNQLEAIVADRNAPQKHVWRAQIVLLTADGCGTAEIMRNAGVSKTVVWRWLYKSLLDLTDDVIWHWRSGGLSVVCITSDLFVTGELRSIEEGLHRGLAEAVASLMGAVFIVFCEPEVKVDLQLVD
jgi:hypothetical protein